LASVIRAPTLLGFLTGQRTPLSEMAFTHARPRSLLSANLLLQTWFAPDRNLQLLGIPWRILSHLFPQGYTPHHHWGTPHSRSHNTFSIANDQVSRVGGSC
jgi:hypothetical protein